MKKKSRKIISLDHALLDKLRGQESVLKDRPGPFGAVADAIMANPANPEGIGAAMDDELGWWKLHIRDEESVQYQAKKKLAALEKAKKGGDAILMVDACTLSHPFTGEIISDFAHYLQQNQRTPLVAMPSESLFEVFKEANESFLGVEGRRNMQGMTRSGEFSKIKFDRLSAAARQQFIRESTGFTVETLPPSPLQQFAPHEDYLQAMMHGLQQELLTGDHLRLYEDFLRRHARELRNGRKVRALTAHFPLKEQAALVAMAAIAKRCFDIRHPEDTDNKTGWLGVSLRDTDNIPPEALIRGYDALEMLKALPAFGFGEEWRKKLDDMGEDSMCMHLMHAIDPRHISDSTLVIMISDDMEALEKFQDVAMTFGHRVLCFNSKELVYAGQSVEELQRKTKSRGNDKQEPFFQHLTPQMQQCILQGDLWAGHPSRQVDPHSVSPPRPEREREAG